MNHKTAEAVMESLRGQGFVKGYGGNLNGWDAELPDGRVFSRDTLPGLVLAIEAYSGQYDEKGLWRG